MKKIAPKEKKIYHFDGVDYPSNAKREEARAAFVRRQMVSEHNAVVWKSQKELKDMQERNARNMDARIQALVQAQCDIVIGMEKISTNLSHALRQVLEREKTIEATHDYRQRTISNAESAAMRDVDWMDRKK